MIDELEQAKLKSFADAISRDYSAKLSCYESKKARGNLLEQIKKNILEDAEIKVNEIDLIIKAGSSKSLEGSLILEASYAEIVFIDKKASELSIDDLKAAIDEYNKRKRNFGV